MSNHVMSTVVGTTAAGSIAAEAPMRVSYLTSHYIGVFTWAECLQLLASAYVAYLLISGIIKTTRAMANTRLGRKVIRKVKGLFR